VKPFSREPRNCHETVSFQFQGKGRKERDRWETSTPAGGTAAFDQVKVLDTARLAVRSAEESDVVEAAIPLKDFGFTPKPGQVLKMD